jgi:hypothetical protein
VKVDTELRTGVPDERAWPVLAGGAWAGPLRLRADGAEYAGMLRLVDVDEDERRAGVHAQARRVGGWGGVALTADVRLAGGVFTIAGRTQRTGAAGAAAEEELERELGRRVARAVLGHDPSPADDPAWRRKLALRAAAAVGVGVVAGLAGAAWDRRRRG